MFIKTTLILFSEITMKIAYLQYKKRKRPEWIRALLKNVSILHPAERHNLPRRF